MVNNTIIPQKTIGKLIKDNTQMRVSKNAILEATNYLELKVKEITEKARLIAANSKRKTIKGKDILLAYEQIKLKI